MKHTDIRQQAVTRAEGWFKRLWDGESLESIAKSASLTYQSVRFALKAAKLPYSSREITRLKAGG